MTRVICDIGDLSGKKIAVLGAGITGTAVAAFLQSHGATVFISEKEKTNPALRKRTRAFNVEFGKHSRAVLDSDFIIKSPGLSNQLPIIQSAKKLNIPIWGELELASLVLKPNNVVAVTGTNGKTTTTSLIASIFKQAGLKTITAGNIGLPLSSVLDKTKSSQAVVLELSSYQLEQNCSFFPKIAVVLNLTPDHLEHHVSMTQYRKAKEKIFIKQNKTDFCMLNYEDRYCRIMARSCPGKIVFFSSMRRLKKGIYYDKKSWHFKYGGKKFSIKSNWQLPGMHNIENGLAAIGAAALFGISPKKIQKAITSFKGVEHRLEQVARKKGVSYINDSKSTNINSTLVALHAVKGPLWLILGGRDKGSSYKPLALLLKKRIKGVLVIGQASNIIKKDLQRSVPLVLCKTLQTAVTYASKHAVPADTVLLSPACASFDQYKNFEQRGKHFKKLVKKIN